MSDGHAEATAPCCVDLSGGGLDVPSAERIEAETATVGVAIDRRAWCRVELGGDGIHVESKDRLLKVAATRIEELFDDDRVPLVGRVLHAMGVEGGVRVRIQSRVPEGSGLGEASAVAVAVAGAARGALGHPVVLDDLARILGELRGGGAAVALERQSDQAALCGGTVAVLGGSSDTRSLSLGVDPARVEESLLLVDSGSTRAGGSRGEGPDGADGGGQASRTTLARIAGELREALVQARWEDVVDLFAAEWEARKLLSAHITTPEIDRIVEMARRAGGAGRACGTGPGGLVAIWAPPGARGAGRREAVAAALEAAGQRVFPVRVDLLGLDVV